MQLAAGLLGLRDGMVSPNRLRAFLGRQFGTAQLQDTEIPTHIVATDLSDGQPVVLSHGSALDALLASSAIPGVFPPVEFDGRQLVDGGVCVDVPVRQAEDLGAAVTALADETVAQLSA